MDIFTDKAWKRLFVLDKDMLWENLSPSSAEVVKLVDAVDSKSTG